MMEMFPKVKEEIEAHPRKYPALHKIWMHKKEIRMLLGEAAKEIKMMVKENPEKFPNGQMIIAKIEEWKAHHMKHH
jgi:hypothetical protein